MPDRRRGAGLPTEFAESVLDLVGLVPPGQALTYGDVAGLLGQGAARAVGAVLARYGGGVPWWRVVRADGTLPPALRERAGARYRAEGTPLLGREPASPDPSEAVAGALRVDLSRCRWEGPGAVGTP